VTRQYSAGAMILTAFVYFDRRVLSFALLAFAATVHNSAVLFFVPWAFVLFFGARLRGLPPGWLIVGGIAAVAVAGSAIFDVVDYVAGGLLSLFKHGLLDNGDLTMFKIASVVAALAVFWYEMKRGLDRKFLPPAYALVFLVVLLALVWQLPLFLLRFSFYVEF